MHQKKYRRFSWFNKLCWLVFLAAGSSLTTPINAQQSVPLACVGDNVIILVRIKKELDRDHRFEFKAEPYPMPVKEHELLPRTPGSFSSKDKPGLF